MGLKGKHFTVFLLFTAVASVLLLSSGLSTTEMSKEWNLFERDNENLGAGNADSINDLLSRLPTIPDTVLQILYLTGIIILPLLILFSLFSPKTRRMILQEIKRALPFAIWIMAFAFLIGRLRFDQLAPPTTASALDNPPVPSWITNPPLLVTIAIGMSLAGLVVGLAWLVWRYVKPKDPLEKLAFEAIATIDEIESGADLTNAIIECYARMCQVLRRERKITRAQGMTPTEFARKLEQFGLAGVQAKRLTRLFEKVRYGQFEATEKERREAISCLEAIVYATSKPAGETYNGRPIEPFTSGGSS